MLSFPRRRESRHGRDVLRITHPARLRVVLQAVTVRYALLSGSPLRHGCNDSASFPWKWKPGHGQDEPWNPARIPLMS